MIAYYGPNFDEPHQINYLKVFYTGPASLFGDERKKTDFSSPRNSVITEV